MTKIFKNLQKTFNLNNFNNNYNKIKMKILIYLINNNY